jgi:hypothetical protein
LVPYVLGSGDDTTQEREGQEQYRDADQVDGGGGAAHGQASFERGQDFGGVHQGEAYRVRDQARNSEQGEKEQGQAGVGAELVPAVVTAEEEQHGGGRDGQCHRPQA